MEKSAFPSKEDVKHLPMTRRVLQKTLTYETSGILSARFDFPDDPPAPPSFDLEGKEESADAEKGW